MVRITSVHMSAGGTSHEHIASVRWINPETQATGESTRAQMVSFIEQNGVAYVSDGANTVKVRVVHATPKYIQTYADKTPTDNLLWLPRF